MSSGKLYVHFAVLIALPEEPLNIALAGEAHFLWLTAREGTLFHVTAGKEVPLFPIRGLTWYVVDVVYDIDRGVYDLSIRVEREKEPLVALSDQPNAANLRGSRLHKFSFIGDHPGRDTPNTVFYVEDILISSERPVPAEGPFVAPGRRMLFVDLDEYYRSRLYERPGCLPALGPMDFGFGDPDVHDLATLGALELYDHLADRRAPKPPAAPGEIPGYLMVRLDAMRLWGEGCAAPPGCREPCALDLFEAAAARAPDAKLYSTSSVLALAAEKRWEEADALFRLGDYDGARLRYEESLVGQNDPATVFTKLSDVHFKLGDLEGERRYREKVYGSLRR